MSKTSRILETGDNQITQKFKTSHKALDIVKYKSQVDNIVAHTAGKVVSCKTGMGNDKKATGTASYGNYVKIDHGNGYTTLYAHLATVAVKNGDVVKQGQVIGKMGNSGCSYGAHLHWEVRKNNVHVDPTPYLNADLPKEKVVEEPHVKYAVYTNKWWSEVTDYNEKDSNGYAGVQGRNVTALTAYSTKGVLKYRAHIIDGKNSRWLSWVSDSNKNDAKNGYAGIKGKAIDAIQMKLEGAPGFEVKYRVSPAKSKNWYQWCKGTTDSTGDGYAGVFGNPIDCIQMDIVKK